MAQPIPANVQAWLRTVLTELEEHPKASTNNTPTSGSKRQKSEVSSVANENVHDALMRRVHELHVQLEEANTKAKAILEEISTLTSEAAVQQTTPLPSAVPQLPPSSLSSPKKRPREEQKQEFIEPLLADNDNRFILFPIKHKRVPNSSPFLPLLLNKKKTPHDDPTRVNFFFVFLGMGAF